jgi:hypothetical protein
MLSELQALVEQHDSKATSATIPNKKFRKYPFTGPGSNLGTDTGYPYWDML